MTNNLIARFAGYGAFAWPAWALLAALMFAASWRAPYLFTDGGIGGLLVTSTPLVLAAMAVTMNALVGSGVDLSIGPAVVFVNVFLVRFLFQNEIGNPWIIVFVALALGVAVQLVLIFTVTYLRLEPVIVTLSGFIALSGLNLMILDKPQGTAPNWLDDWGRGASAISPMFWVLGIAIVGWFLLSRTSLYANILLVGSDIRASWVSGVSVRWVQFAAHAVSGLLIGLAGLAYTGAIGSGNPGQGATYTLTAVTAVVLGGTVLSGGRGGIFGSIPGAFAIALISYVLTTFSLGSMASFVTQVVYGALLVLALVLGLFVRRAESRNRAVAK